MMVMLNLGGAVALLLFGLALVKDGMTLAFGPRLRKGLHAGTRGPVRAFVAGLVATVLLQSSTATALMIASFVERQLVAGTAGQIVLLGANIGTAITAWLVASGTAWVSPLLILAGYVLRRSRDTNTRKGGGNALIGIGLMLLSLHHLTAATEPLRESPALLSFIALLGNALPVALILAAVLAMISSSSLAVVVLILTLSQSALLSVPLTFALVLGANIGGAVTPVLATLRAPAATRRVMFGNLGVRVIGALAVMPFAEPLAAWLVSLKLSPAMLPVDIHLGYNLVLGLIVWPLSGLLSRAMERLIPDDPARDFGPEFIAEHELKTPLMALSSATREVLRIGDLIEAMLMRTITAFETGTRTPLAEIPDLEARVDKLQQAVKLYLSRLNRSQLSEAEASGSMNLMDYAINLEHVGDIIEKGLAEEVFKKIDSGLVFSPDGEAELRELFDITLHNLRIAQTVVVSHDINLARQLMEIKERVRTVEKRSAENHLLRLQQGRRESMQTSSLHLDILRDLKRINAHLVTVAHPILDDLGLLRESRLREPDAAPSRVPSAPPVQG
ncbi:Na/Pi cotransporter family protein [Pseudogemmobacter humi]|uniref:Na/Pi cotransporter family protein n=1 Tax=Pseudogemmobacter humi TaxID=2483812 RepID=UPI001F1DBAED|nr:Na/Pi cotransporter family protein [Pseudogemmobacter humi]